MSRKAVVFIVASLGFFLVMASTFTTLGVALYTMAGQLGWSNTAAGLSFSLLGLACGFGSPLAPLMMKAIGTRLTMCFGALVLGAGFLIASQVSHIGMFFVATSLMGVGFSLIAPAPAVFLIATWFPNSSARMMGYYFMFGAAGGVAGPLIVSNVIRLTGDWRLNWMAMAVFAGIYAVLCVIGIRDAVKVESVDQIKGIGGKTGEDAPKGTIKAVWTLRAALRAPAFLIVAAVMTVVQTAVTTMNADLVTHVAKMGIGAERGAIALSLLALAGTIAKGITGNLCERIDPKIILVIGLALLTLGTGILWPAHSLALAFAGAVLFGIGWGMAWLASNVLLLHYFGAAIAAEMIAMSTFVTSFAVLGPVAAGRVADVTGSYALAMLGLAILLAVTTLATLAFLHPPPKREVEEEKALLFPAQ